METTTTIAPAKEQPKTATPQPSPGAIEADKPGFQSLYDLIKEQSFFAGLDARQLQLLAESAMETRFEIGQSIFEQGSPANRFYLILEGNVTLESDLKDRGRISIQTLGPGDALGWSWLFPPYHVHLSARALEPTRAIFFFGTRLREQCEQDHDLGFELMKRIAEVMVNCLAATQRRLQECADATNPQS